MERKKRETEYSCAAVAGTSTRAKAVRNGVSLGSIQQYFRIYMLNCRGDPEKCRRLESDFAFSKGIRQNGETVRDAKTDNVYSHRSH